MLPASETDKWSEYILGCVLKPSELPTKTTFVGITDAIECPEMLSKWAAGLVLRDSLLVVNIEVTEIVQCTETFVFLHEGGGCVCGNIFFTALLRFTLTFLFNFILIFHSYMYNPKQKKKLLMNTLFL